MLVVGVVRSAFLDVELRGTVRARSLHCHCTTVATSVHTHRTMFTRSCRALLCGAIHTSVTSPRSLNSGAKRQLILHRVVLALHFIRAPLLLLLLLSLLLPPFSCCPTSTFAMSSTITLAAAAPAINRRKRREHPLFTDNPAIYSARQRLADSSSTHPTPLARPESTPSPSPRHSARRAHRERRRHFLQHGLGVPRPLLRRHGPRHRLRPSPAPAA